VAAEALAIGFCCALAAGNDFRKGVSLAVNHSGNSDSTASITGHLVGAHLGVESIPGKWLSDLELRRVIEDVATDVYHQYGKG
jgi:ADP-ribosylglycohydrolase